MASLVNRTASAFWYVKFLDASTGERRFSTTKFRKDDPLHTRKARALVAQLAAREFEAAVQSPSEHWDTWVPAFLERHTKTPRTLDRYRLGWSWIRMYLAERRVPTPSQLTYQDALGFLQWRTGYKKRKGKSVKLNTALNDIKVLRIVMRQAVRLRYASSNPVDRLGVAREDAPEKPELTDDDIRAIRAALKGKPEWMSISFEIAIHTGCRESETQIELSNIDLARKTITFASPKGGKDRAFTVPLPPALEPLFRGLKRRGFTRTLEGTPPMLAKTWWQFFKHEMNRPDLCFHCCRVTFVTRLARANVPQSAAMRLVNHSSTLVHRIYQRLGVDDVRSYHKNLAIPTD